VTVNEGRGLRSAPIRTIIAERSMPTRSRPQGKSGASNIGRQAERDRAWRIHLPAGQTQLLKFPSLKGKGVGRELVLPSAQVLLQSTCERCAASQWDGRAPPLEFGPEGTLWMCCGQREAGSGPRFFLASIKRNPDAPRLPPNDMARPTWVVRLDDQFEPVRDEQWGYDLERSAGVRNVANGAVN